MIAWLFPAESARRLLPDDRGRATPWIIAIMTFVTIVIAAGGLALANAADLVGSAAERQVSIQLDGVPEGSVDLEARLRRTPGVADFRRVPEREVRATLEQWLGPDSEGLGLPLPVLLEVKLAPDADPRRVASDLRRAVPGARVSTYAQELAPLARSLAALQWLALGLIALMAAATSAAVVLAARGALDTHRGTIEVMHGIGATDRQVVLLFQRRMALDALLGGMAGAVAAAVALLLVLGPAAALLGGLAGGIDIGSRDLLLLAAIPLVLAVLATVVARVAVQRALRATL